MRYMFELSGEHPELPVWEAQAVLSCYGESKLLDRDGTVAIFSSDAKTQKFISRIALSHFVSEHLLSAEIKDIESAFSEADIPKCRSAAVRVKLRNDRRKQLDALTIARKLGRIISNRTRINLDNPELTFRVYIGDRAHVGIQLAEIDRSQFESRKNRLLPFVSPVSIHPRLARALVNLTVTKPSATVLDPFCGTGAILIEASEMGFRTFGSDISEEMIDGARKNLRYLGLKAELKRLDVSRITEFGMKFDSIVTDPPYGRASSTRKEPLRELYARALSAFYDNLVKRGRIGIIIPNDEVLDYEEYFVLVRKTSVRVHRSLTRNFFILEKK